MCSEQAGGESEREGTCPLQEQVHIRDGECTREPGASCQSWKDWAGRAGTD